MAKNRFIPSNQIRGLRQVGTFPITQDNQQILVDLPRGPHVEYCAIRLSGSANITTGFTAVRNIGAALFLRRVDWVLNSNVTLDSLSGAQLMQQYVTRRQAPALTSPAGFGISVQPFEAMFLLDRAVMDMMRPKDSLLKTDEGVSNNQLRLQFGSLSNMFTGAGVASYTNVTCSVMVGDYQEQRDADGQTPSPAWYAKRNGSFTLFSGAGNGQQIKLNTGNRLRMVSCRFLDSVTGEPSLANVTRLRIQRSGDTRIDVSTSDLRSANSAMYGGTLLSGQVLFDFANPGLMGARYSEFWPIPSGADTFLLLDTTGAVGVETSTLEGVDIPVAK